MTFKLPAWRILAYSGAAAFMVAFGVVSIVTGGPSWWAVAIIVVCGIVALAAARGLLLEGMPSVTVTRAGLTRNARREVGFDETGNW